MRKFKRPTRAGDQYQDLFGIEFIKEWLINPDKYEYLEFEAGNTNGTALVGLDDIVAKRSDGKFELLQIKFTVDPSNDAYHLSFDWLLASRPTGTSLVQKWATDISAHIDANTLHQAMLKTNRKPDDIFTMALSGNKLNFSEIPPQIRGKMINQLGGEDALKQFCAHFIFYHSEPMLEDFENNLESLLVPDFTDEHGWLRLLKEVPKWSTVNNFSPQDGRIHLAYIKQLLSTVRPEPIPQNFYTPPSYEPPDGAFHTNMMERVVTPGVTIVCGTPGIGKSTYISHIVECLEDQEIHVARHHFFLSLSDTSSDRIRFETVFKSINNQISKWLPDELFSGKSDEFLELLEVAAASCAKEEKILCLVIDGLDHVWRQRGEIGQLERLFNHLFPLPDNLHLIIGTQKVADNQLPQVLKTRIDNDEWLELPAMSQTSVGSFLKNYIEDGVIAEDELHHCSVAIFNKTRGHPLLLCYTIQSIINTHKMITQDNIATMPDYNGGDIKGYYSDLWGRLSEYAREMLHLIASSMFAWPDENSFYQCLGEQTENIEAFRLIQHMLISQKSGLRAFHESILAFIREQPEHSTAAQRLLPKTKKWLENSAPDYWKWAYLWLVKARLSETEDIITKPDRAWLIDAFTKAYPVNQIKCILEIGKLEALKEGRLVDLTKLNHLHWRLSNGYEYATGDYPKFLDLALACSEDTYVLDWRADNTNLIDAPHLPVVTKHLGPSNPKRQRKCFDEMNDRLRFDFEFNKEFMSDTETSLFSILEIVTYTPSVDAEKVISFVTRFSNKEQLFEHFLHHMLLQARGEEILKIWSNSKLTDELKEPLANYSTQYLLRENIDVYLRPEKKFLHYSLLGKILLTIRKIEFPPSNHSQISFNKSASDISITSWGGEDYLQYFKESLLTALSADGKFSFTNIQTSNRGPKKTSLKVATLLQNTARYAAHLLFENPSKLLNWTNIYGFLEGQQQILIAEHDSWRAQNGLKSCLLIIALELAKLAQTKNLSIVVPSNEDLNKAEASQWFQKHQIIYLSTKWESKLISDESAKILINEAQSAIRDSVVEQWDIIEEAQTNLEFALLYNQPEMAKELLKHASTASLGYLTRKDNSSLEFIQALEYCAEAGRPEIHNWMVRLEPIVNNIMDYTDGKGTRHAPLEFIKIVSKYSPINLPNLLEHYQLKEEWWYRDATLKAIIEVADLSDPAVQSLMRTLSEIEHLNALQKRAGDGEAIAQNLLDGQIDFLGGWPTQKNEHSLSDVQDYETEAPLKSIDVAAYPPENFYEFVSQFDRVGISFRETVDKWIEHWANTDAAIKVIEVMEEHYHDKELHFSGDEYLWKIFNLSIAVQGKNKSFEWAVRAAAHTRIWDSFWDHGSEENLTRIAELYPNKWLEFIQKTATEIDYKYGRKFGVVVGSHLLVFFLIKVGQIDLAAQVTEAMMCSLEEDVVHMPLPKMQRYTQEYV